MHNTLLFAYPSKKEVYSFIRCHLLKFTLFLLTLPLYFYLLILYLSFCCVLWWTFKKYNLSFVDNWRNAQFFCCLFTFKELSYVILLTLEEIFRIIFWLFQLTLPTKLPSASPFILAFTCSLTKCILSFIKDFKKCILFLLTLGYNCQICINDFHTFFDP